MTPITIIRDGVEWGPFPPEEVNRLLMTGQLVPSDLAWTEGMTAWEPLAGLPGVQVPPADAAPVLATVPPAPPAVVTVTKTVWTPPAPRPLPAALPITSGAAVTSLIFGILALLICWFPLLGVPLAIVAIVCGHVARGNVRNSRSGLTGKGLALSGLLMGYLGILVPMAAVFFAFRYYKAVKQKVEASRPTTPEAVATLRRNFVTVLTRQEKESEPAAVSTDRSMKLVQYPAPLGPMDAYVSATAAGNKPLPALVWLVGGFGNSISPDLWIPGPPENDQSASSFHHPELVMLYPSLRGGNRNPGFKEGLFGEVEDVAAAVKWLAGQPGVDSTRIYLGGHSTGGTLALLAAESVPGLRAVFSFGPVADVSDYGQENLPYDIFSGRENDMRSPVRWLGVIPCPTFVMEGTDGNLASLQQLKAGNHNPQVRVLEAEGHDHFSILQPVSRLILPLLLQDKGPDARIPLTEVTLRLAPANGR